MYKSYNHTLRACYIGFIVQAIVNNFAPLLFLTFHNQFDIALSKITLLITINFAVQLTVDFLSAGFLDKIGYRASAVLAHILSAVGLISLSILPSLLPNPFIGLLAAVIIYAAGGGILEVLISPLAEACPTEHKEKTMSMLHSFYCWGQVGVVLGSTLFFSLFGVASWKYLALLWALVPAANAIFFTKVPIAPLISEGEKELMVGELIKQKIFWLFVLLMVCSGASELAVSQWASTFAEQALGVSKTIGDLAGPMFFAVMMGSARLLYGKYGHKINLDRFMLASGILCLLTYLIISLSPSPVIGLIGLGFCGLSVGIMWPGTFSRASASIKGGGTAMFAYLALAGDLGAAAGPTLVGFVSGAFGDQFRIGILAAILFPVLFVGVILLSRRPIVTDKGAFR